MPQPELDVSLPDLESWKTLCREQPFVCDPGASREIVEQAKRQGIVSPHFGSIGPGKVKVGGPNYRESFFAGGLNPRARALLDELAGMPKASQRFRLRIFAPEALSPFALRLRGLYPLFYGSEYLPDKAERERLFPIPHQDLEALSLSDLEPGKKPLSRRVSVTLSKSRYRNSSSKASRIPGSMYGSSRMKGWTGAVG